MTPLKWNDFGYNLGGPLFISGHYNTAKNRTFFFWSENWHKYRQGEVISALTPSLRMRQGDFSECNPASANFNPAISGCALPIIPDTGAPFQGDVVPIDPNGKALLDGFFPLPNNGVIGYVSAPSVPNDWRQEQIRVEHNLTDKTRVFVRYTQDAVGIGLVPGWASWFNSYDTVKDRWNTPGKAAVLNLTQTLQPGLMNEFVMAYGQDNESFLLDPHSNSPAGSLNKPPSWTANGLFPPNRSNPLLPGVVVCGGVPFSGGCAGGDAWILPWFTSNPILTWKDNLAWAVSKHTLKFGLYFEKFRKNEVLMIADTQGWMEFTGWDSVTTGNALADMYLGRMGQYMEGTGTMDGRPVGGEPKGHWRMTIFEPYFQDDWKVNRKLTLNLGARYQLFVPMHDVSHPTVDASFIPSLYDPGKEALLDANGNLVLDPATGHGHDYTTYGNGLVECGSGGIPPGCTRASRGTLGPRFGFAYDPWGSGKTVVRGGYGIYYEMGNGNESNAEGISGNPPVALSTSGYNIVGYQNIVPGALGPSYIYTLPQTTKWPSTQQFSLGMQHEFSGSNLLSVGYVGNLGRHLARGRELDQVPIGVGSMLAPELAGTPGCDAAGNCDVQNILINNQAPNIHFLPYRGYSNVLMRENSAISHYDSLQVNLRHTVGKGLMAEASYTWSHAIDDASSGSSFSSIDDSNLTRWRATSDRNRTQVLVMNYIYALPFFKTSSSALTRSVLGGWRVSGITSFFTGVPTDFTCGINGYSSGIGENVKCNSLGKLQVKKGVVNDPEFGPTPTWFDPNTIGQVTFGQLRADGQPGMFGSMGRNVLTGPGRNNWDMALLKDFELPWYRGDHSTLQFRWETFNTFNHPQWGMNSAGTPGINAGCDGQTPPGSPCGPATLPDGTTINRNNGQVSAAWPARIMQFGLKFIF